MLHILHKVSKEVHVQLVVLLRFGIVDFLPKHLLEN